MRRFSIFLVSSLLILPTLVSIPTQSQQSKDKLPSRADFPPVTSACKRKGRLVAKVTGDRVGTSTRFAECLLEVHRTCANEKQEYRSGPRDVTVRKNVCEDFYAAARELNRMEICCDEKAPETGSSSQGCPQSTPWFDPSHGYKDLQATQLQITGDTATVSVCGHTVFTYQSGDLKDPLFANAYRAALKDRLSFDGSTRICCDQVAEATRTGEPCDPRTDIDCDGTPNAADHEGTVPNINPFQRSAGGNIDPFPPRFNTSDPDFRPERTARNSKGVGDCPCQWELTGGELRCSPDGKQQHYYKATWRCPTTGAEVFTVKYEPATTPCSK
jgi:hypothetical protein